MTETPAAVTTLPCGICGRHPEAMDGDPDVPYGADIFTSEGHYGSTRYDPVFGKECLKLLICAACLDTMVERQVIERIKPGTEEEPGSRVIFGSEQDTDPDNPFNRLRLANEAAMVRALETQPGMDEEKASAIFEACEEASRHGRRFHPSNV